MKKLFDMVKNIFSKKGDGSIYYVCEDAKGELMGYCRTEIRR